MFPVCELRTAWPPTDERTWGWVVGFACVQLMDVLVLLHSSLVVLPKYALTASVGSHCSQSIQK